MFTWVTNVLKPLEREIVTWEGNWNLTLSVREMLVSLANAQDAVRYRITFDLIYSY